MTSATSLQGAEIVCRTLCELGARHVFGVPGTQNTAFYEAMRRSKLRSVVPTHELAAAFMAGAYHRASGRPGILTTIPGPGLAYTLAGLAEARLDSAAVVYLVNAREAGAKVGFGLQAIDQHALLAPVTKAILGVSRLEDIAETVRRGWHLSLSGEPGPVVIELGGEAGAAIDITLEEPGATAVAAAWQRIAEAHRPLILAGQGALASALEVCALAERWGAPVLTTPSARGIVPETSPLAMGFDSLKETLEAANALLARSDLVLVLGAKLGHNGSAGFELVIPEARMVRVDTCADALLEVYPAAHRLQMDVGAFLACAQARANHVSGWSAGELASARAAISKAGTRDEPRVAGGDPATFFAALGEALAPDVRVVTDTGMHQVMTRRHLSVRAARGLLVPSDFQSMGFGLPAAIACALAEPGAPVVALIGDGGLRLTGFELSTAVREKLALTVIVFNDGSLNQIRLQQLGEYGAASGTDLGPLDLLALADAVGVEYALVSSAGELGQVLATRIASGGVTLIEVPVGDSPSITTGAIKARAKAIARRLVGGSLAERVKTLVRGRR